jgi:hypothetical protein
MWPIEQLYIELGFLLQLLAHAQLRHDKEFLSKKTDGSGIIQDFL